jgi:hypothetical protein
MITEIVKFSIPEGMSHKEVVAGFESTRVPGRRIRI